MQNIFIDLTGLARKITGIENYTLNLFRNVVIIDKSNQYHLLFRKEIHSAFTCIDKANLHFYLSPYKSQFLTEQLYIPFFLLGKKFNKQVFPCFPPGIFAPVRNLQIICYDASMWLFSETISLKNKLYFRPLTERAIKKAQTIFTISESSKQGISRVFPFAASKIVNIKAALPEGFAPVPKKEALSECRALGVKTPFLLSVGSLEPRKNLLFTIRVLEPLLREKNMQLVLVGRNAWGTDEISNEIAKRSLENHIVRTGFISSQQLQCLYSTAEMFIFPSLYEGFGFPIVEAFSCGCPVISSNTSSIPEVAGDAALLIDPHDENQLKQAVVSLLENPARRNELCLKGTRQVTNFNWVDCASKFLEHLNRA